MKDLKIIEIMELFDEGEVTTADQIDRPERALEKEMYKDFMDRNPLAGGGMLVQPGFGGTRQGYAEPVGNRKGQFTTKAMDNVSDAILKAYAKDDIQILFEKGKNNPQGLLTPKDSKAGIFQKIKTDQDRLNTVVKNTGLDQETILNILDDRDAFLELEKTTVSQETRFKEKRKFFNKAEKWLTTNAKRYSDPAKFEKAFIRTFGKNNPITKTIKANITDPRGSGRLFGFSDDFAKTIMAVREGTTKVDPGFNSIQLKDMFKTVIYNNNPSVRKRITNIFENIIPEPGSKRTPDIRKLFENDPVLKKFGLNKSIKGPIARLIANEINEDLLTNVKNFQKPFLGTDALLSYLKDRVDPKYKEMFKEASNAVKQAQKNQWPLAKKTLNFSQSIMFDHKIPKALIEAGYADEIEYIKLNPTSEKFNATIKRSQFDQPLLNLIDEFERSKTLDAKANVVTKMNKLKNDFSKKYGGYLDEVSINVDKTGKPIFKSSASPVTRKTDFVSSLGKSMTQTGEINKEQFKKLLASFSANPKCRASFGKKDGGRINYAKGPAGLSECAISGRNRLEKVIKGGVQLGNQEGILARQILRAGRSLGSAFTLSGLFGPAAIAFTAAAEAGIVGYDMLTTGKTFKEAVGDSLLNYALGEKTKIDPNKELFKRFGRKDEQGNFLIKGMTDDKLLNIAKVFDQSNQLNTILKQQLKTADLEKLVEAERAQPKNQFVGPDDEMLQTDEAIRREQDLKNARQELENLLTDYRTPLPVDTGDFGGLSKEEAILADMASGTFEQSQKDFADATKAAEIQKLESRGPTSFGQFSPKFEESRQAKLLDLRANINPASRFAIEAYENPGSTSFTPMKPFGLAGGGIAKLAGIDEGPQTESLNPDSQGLSGLLKRAKKA